jgi:hypothetical protein
MAVQRELLFVGFFGETEMEKVKVSVNVQGEIADAIATLPETVEDCCKLLREDELTQLCRNYVKRMVISDLQCQAEYVRIMKAYDVADDTRRRDMLSTALGSGAARKTLLRTIE